MFLLKANEASNVCKLKMKITSLKIMKPSAHFKFTHISDTTTSRHVIIAYTPSNLHKPDIGTKIFTKETPLYIASNAK